MRGRKPEPLTLTAKDKKTLLQILGDGQTPVRIARRAQILLNCAKSNQRTLFVSDKVEQNRTTIWRVCERYRNAGFEAALYDAPRSGRPRVFSQTRPRGH